MEKALNWRKEAGEKKSDHWKEFQDSQKMLEMSQEQIRSVLENENDFFVFPEGKPDLLARAIDAEDYFFETSWVSDNPQDPKGLPVKVFRSLEWQAENLKDKEYQHSVIYLASCDAVAKEYLPKDLEECFEKKFQLIKEKYLVLGTGRDRDEILTRKVLFDKTATHEEQLEYKKNRQEAEKGLDELQDFKRAIMLLSPRIEKTVVVFKNPLIFRDCRYGVDAFSFSQQGIKDIRFIAKDEIEKIKKQGYDGIAFEQFGWFISF